MQVTLNNKLQSSKVIVETNEDTMFIHVVGGEKAIGVSLADVRAILQFCDSGEQLN